MIFYISPRKRLTALRKHGATWGEISALYGLHKTVIWKYYEHRIEPKDREIRRKLGLVEPRPAAIRLAFPPGVDAHAEQQRILDLLTPLERYHALSFAAKLKEYKKVPTSAS